MSLTLLKSGHYKCKYCNLIFKTQEAAKAHLYTTRHKANRQYYRSNEMSTLSTTSSKALSKKQILKMEDSILSDKAANAKQTLIKKYAPKMEDSIASQKNSISKPALKPYQQLDMEKSIRSMVSDAISSGEAAKHKKRARAEESSSSNIDEIPYKYSDSHYNNSQFDVLVAKLDYIIEKQNLLELKIETISKKQDMAYFDRKKALYQAIDIDPVISKNVEEIKKIEAAERIVQERLGMLSRTGNPNQSGVGVTLRSSVGSKKCPMCGSNSGW